MDKERLEDIIQVLVNSHYRYLNSESTTKSEINYKNYVDYSELITEKFQKQAERVQELVDEIYQHLEDKESLKKQNKRYREALELILVSAISVLPTPVTIHIQELADKALESEEC